MATSGTNHDEGWREVVSSSGRRYQFREDRNGFEVVCDEERSYGHVPGSHFNADEYEQEWAFMDDPLWAQQAREKSLLRMPAAGGIQ
jgi:hypothetical protein